MYKRQPKDIEAGQAVLVRRDTHEKITVALSEIAEKVDELLKTIQHDMYERAKAHRDAHTYDAHNMEEMKDIADNKPGFIRAMWLSLIHIFCPRTTGIARKSSQKSA